MTALPAESPRPTLLWYAVGLTLLLLAGLASLAFGALNLNPVRALSLLLHPGNSSDSLVVWTLRGPRTVAALLAGAALGVSGALLQGVTRNPLADPGILGVEAGAALALLATVVFLPGFSGLGVPLAFAGGLGAAGLTLAFASRTGLTPIRLALAGVAVAALCAALTRGIQLLWEERAQGAVFALAGSVAGRTWLQVGQAAPWIMAGLMAAFVLARRVNVLALGEDVARGLGVNTRRDTLLVSGLGVLLAAAAVSLTGPIGYVGLVVPHLTRGLLGRDHRLTLPLSALLGGALLTFADVAARLIDKPAETPVGILIAALGTPFFIALARRQRA
ncbi:FecCD family ABC transporter permease [Deinococcus hopiensis]|uniref:Iron complex transport system permease protein n=1 Tax=Deinococcus hopiensis KR-140 TaxID=695939 RepID=A0A1W1VEU6_9DEIO|nr:iron ABC transporter permease [Deinococcus hopiensis]SMB91740.1 iron complex transport system permease protein [Deinococcus hopiensis KR-140]